MNKTVIITLGMAACLAQGHAQNNRNSTARQALDDFRREVRGELNDFRRQAMEQFIDFVKNPWQEFEQTAPTPAPHDEPVPPVTIPEEDRDKPVEDNPVIIEEVITPPQPEPQPQPVAPIEEVPVREEKKVTFTFFGTEGSVRCDATRCPRITGAGRSDIAHGLELLSDSQFDNLILDCLQLRRDLQLSDWAYLNMLRSLSTTIAGTGTNSSVLLMAYLYMQSGYKMRLATHSNHLLMLYNSRHRIYDKVVYEIDGELYYCLDSLPARLNICQAAYPGEKGLSLLVNSCQRLQNRMSQPRTITSRNYADFSLTTSVNLNLIDFYNTYPTSMLGDDFMTRWAMYANTPLDSTVAIQVKTDLEGKLSGMGQKEAVQRLLNLLQTGLQYEYDNTVWGQDRAFFPEETLYYPYADCEDRAILLSRMVRDLMGLRCILVYYPGHLAMAIAFTEDVQGDYIMTGQQRYVVCDPTFIGAPVGVTMPGMDNMAAKVIMLE